MSWGGTRRLQQVGVVITHCDNDDREYHISGKQVAMVAEMAKECGEHFVVVRSVNSFRLCLSIRAP